MKLVSCIIMLGYVVKGSLHRFSACLRALSHKKGPHVVIGSAKLSVLKQQQHVAM